jgi:phosphatidate phosphatase PAH1
VSLDLLSLNKYKSSYVTMQELLDHFFPPTSLLVHDLSVVEKSSSSCGVFLQYVKSVYSSPPSCTRRLVGGNSNAEVSLDLLSLNKYKSSYVTMQELLDHFFPPIVEKSSSSCGVFLQYVKSVYSSPPSCTRRLVGGSVP